MSRFEKLLQRIKSLDKNMRFKEIKKILESYGYIMNGCGGSHKTFRKPGCNPITIPMNEPIRRVYILLVKDVIESEEKNEQNN